MSKRDFLPGVWNRDRNQEGRYNVPDLTTRISRGLELMIRDLFSSPSTDFDWNITKELSPRAELYDDDKNYYIEIEMPGIKEKDINVTISGDNLEIKGEKKYEEEKKEKGSYYSEREFGSFYRSMLLPDSVTADKIQAKYKNGVLKLTLPKSEEKKQDVKKIEIQKD